MADNATFQTSTPATLPSGLIVAADEVAYSGDTTKVQLMRLVHVSGSEGSKTLSEIADATNGLDVDVTRLPVMTFTESGSGSATTTPAAVDGTASRVTLVQADDDNTVDIYVGNASAQGIRLTPGASVTLPVSAAAIYAKTLSGTATYRYASFN